MCRLLPLAQIDRRFERFDIASFAQIDGAVARRAFEDRFTAGQNLGQLVRVYRTAMLARGGRTLPTAPEAVHA